MKKLALIAALVFGIAMVSCKSKEEKAMDAMKDAAQQVNKQMQDAAKQLQE